MSFFRPSKGSFNGIIQYFNNNYYNTLYSHVNVTVSSTNNNPDFNNLSSIIDFKYQNSHWASKDEPNQSIMIHFLNNRVSVTYYSLRTRRGGENFPLSWNFEGSNDNSHWTMIHAKEVNGDLNSSFAFKTYRASIDGVFSFFRVTMNEKNSNSSHIFHIERFEIFGALCNNEGKCHLPLFSLCKSINHYHSSISLLLFVLIS